MVLFWEVPFCLLAHLSVIVMGLTDSGGWEKPDTVLPDVGRVLHGDDCCCWVGTTLIADRWYVRRGSQLLPNPNYRILITQDRWGKILVCWVRDGRTTPALVRKKWGGGACPHLLKTQAHLLPVVEPAWSVGQCKSRLWSVYLPARVSSGQWWSLRSVPDEADPPTRKTGGCSRQVEFPTHGLNRQVLDQRSKTNDQRCKTCPSPLTKRAFSLSQI